MTQDLKAPVFEKLSVLLWQCNSNDDSGVLRGNWVQRLEGGTSPTALERERDILRQYYKKRRDVLSNSASAGSIQESPHLVRLDLFLSRPTARKKYYLIMFLGIKSSVDDMTKLLRKKNLKNIEEKTVKCLSSLVSAF